MNESLKALLKSAGAPETTPEPSAISPQLATPPVEPPEGMTDADFERQQSTPKQNPLIEQFINQTVDEKVEDHNFDPISFAHTNKDTDPDSYQLAKKVWEKRNAQGWKDKAGRAFKNAPQTMSGAAGHFGNFLAGIPYSLIHLGKQAGMGVIETVTGEEPPEAATLTAETIIGAQKGEQSFKDFLEAVTGPVTKPLNGYAESRIVENGVPNREALDHYGQRVGEYSGMLRKGIEQSNQRYSESSFHARAKDPTLMKFPEDYADKQQILVNSAVVKLRNGQALQDDEKKAMDSFIYAMDSIDQRAPGLKEMVENSKFDHAVSQFGNQAKLAQGIPLDEGLVADYIESRGDGAQTSEMFGPENLASIGAPPVDPAATNKLGAVADPNNLLLMRAPSVPGAGRIGGAMVQAATKPLELAGKAATHLPTRWGAGMALYDLLRGNFQTAAATAVGTVAKKDLEKIGTLAKDIGEFGKMARTGGKFVPGANKALAEARLAGKSAPGAWVKNIVSNTAVATAAMPVGMAGFNAVAAGALPGGQDFNLEQFISAELGSPIYGLLGAGNGIKPQLVEAIRPQLRQQGEARIAMNNSELGQKSAQFIASLPEAQKNAIYETAALFEGLEGSGESGKAAKTEIYILPAAEYAKVSGNDSRGFATQEGKVFVNGEHQQSQGGELTHTLGHEAGGHGAMNMLRAMTSKGGNLYTNLIGQIKKELGTTRKGVWTPSAEFKTFIDTYNAALPEGAKKVDPSDPAAFEEFLSETAGQIIAAKGAASIVMPDGIRDKVQQGAAQVFSKMLGFDNRQMGTGTKFNREESGAVNAAFLDALSRIADVRFRPSEADDISYETPLESTTATPPKETSKVTLPTTQQNQARNDAIAALRTLGFSKAEAEKRVAAATGETTEELVRGALATQAPATAPIQPSPAVPDPTKAPAVAPDPAQPAPAPSNAAQEAPASAGTPVNKTQEAPLSAVSVETSINRTEEPKPLAEEPAPEPVKPVRKTAAEIAPLMTAAEEALKTGKGWKRVKDQSAKLKAARVNAALEVAGNESGGDTDLLQPRTDADGKVTYSGRIDPSIESHRVLLEETTTPTGRDILQQLQDRRGETVFVDYRSAEKQVQGEVYGQEQNIDRTGAQRREEYVANDVQSRRKDQDSGVVQNKAFHVMSTRVNPGTGTVTVFGFSPDKLLSNAGKLITFLKSEGQETGYKDINDPELVMDAQRYAENHANGYRGDGSGPISGGNETPNLNFEPHPIAPEKFHLLNAAFGNEVATKTQSKRAETRQKANEAQLLAFENERPLAPDTGDPNPLRDYINKSGKFQFTNQETGKTRAGTEQMLETVFEQISPDLVTKVTKDKPDSQTTVRPAGFEGQPADVTARGVPKGKYVAAGFMPKEGDSEPTTPKFTSLWIDRSGNIRGAMRAQAHADLLKDMPGKTEKDLLRAAVRGTELHLTGLRSQMTPGQLKSAKAFAEDHGLTIKTNDDRSAYDNAFMPEEKSPEGESSINRSDVDQEQVRKAAAAEGYRTKLYHGTDEARNVYDGGVFFTDSAVDASAYAEMKALQREVENNEELSEIVYDVIAEQGGEEITDLGPKAIREIADANGIDLSNPDGHVMEAYVKTDNTLDLTEFGSDVGSVPKLWNALHRKGLINEPWSKLDEEARQEIEDEYKGMAIYKFLEKEGVQNEAFKKGYDSVKFEDISPDGGSSHFSWLVKEGNQFKSADKETRDDSGKVIPLGERFDKSKSDIRYLPKEEKNLAGVHNLSVDNLRNVLKIGGLPAPSMAAIRTDKSKFHGFGDITLIGGRDLIDPQRNKDAKWFNADIYSPRYPSTEIVIPYKEADKITNHFKKYREELNEIVAPGDYQWGAGSIRDAIEDRGFRETAYKTLAQYAYLRENGLIEKPEPGTPETEVNDKVYNLSRDKHDAISEWIKSQVDEAGIKYEEKIFDGFTNSGNRRRIPHTIDNVLKILKRSLRDGEGFNYGVPSIRANVAKKYGSLEKMGKDRDKVIPEEEMELLKKQTSDEFLEMAEEVNNLRKNPIEGFNMMEAISDDFKAVAQGRDWKYLRDQYGDNLTAMTEIVRPFLDKLREMPTEYFEGKIRRAVSLSEFDGAVIPDNTPDDLVKELERRGISVKKYPKGDNEARRKLVEEISQERDVRFMPEEKKLTLWQAERHVGDIKEGPSLGLFYTDNEQTANSLADLKGKVSKVDVDLKNPLVFESNDGSEYFDSDTVNDLLKKAGVDYQVDDIYADDEFWRIVDSEGLPFIDALKKAGYDSMQYPEFLGGKDQTTTLVFEKPESTSDSLSDFTLDDKDRKRKLPLAP